MKNKLYLVGNAHLDPVWQWRWQEGSAEAKATIKETFAMTARVGYNVDSFGHNAMLPQILKKSGMDSYIFMRPGPHEKEMERHAFCTEIQRGQYRHHTACV